MQLIKPSYEILQPEDWRIWGVCKHIELCGRTCYKSTDKITTDSYNNFVERLIDFKHYAMLEHGTIYLSVSVGDPHDYKNINEYKDNKLYFESIVNRYASNKYSIVKLNNYEDRAFITTNYRVLVENGWLNDTKLMVEPTVFHEKRYSVKFICNRQVANEFVRHRVFSFAQESTRYCNYSNDRFGGQLTFIQPSWTYDEHYEPSKYDNSDEFIMLSEMLENVESCYNYLISHGWLPQQAATVLPSATKTELIMTGFSRDWVHFFELRALGKTGAPHPQAKELAKPLMDEFISRGYINSSNLLN